MSIPWRMAGRYVTQQQRRTDPADAGRGDGVATELRDEFVAQRHHLAPPHCQKAVKYSSSSAALWPVTGSVTSVSRWTPLPGRSQAGPGAAAKLHGLPSRGSAG